PSRPLHTMAGGPQVPDGISGGPSGTRPGRGLLPQPVQDPRPARQGPAGWRLQGGSPARPSGDDQDSVVGEGPRPALPGPVPPRSAPGTAVETSARRPRLSDG